MKTKIHKLLENCPIITAVKDQKGLERCLESESKIVFVLFGDVCTIADIVKRIKESGRVAMVHLDLISGLSNKEISVDYIKEYTLADGIITTKPPLIKRAKSLDLFTVLRLFVIDSMAFQNVEKLGSAVKPDLIEILPGVMPKVIQKICKLTRIPIIAGGLIQDKEDVMNALSAGAISISSTDESVWFL
ncbi:MAG: glycerol-3-phosphate responsive antiterminator [Velocimicrobium sp.]